jgi:SRSO17 transposase
MDFLLDHDGEERLKSYFDRIGDVLGYKKRRASFALYAFGLFGDAERKSVEPIAARACADPEKTDALHQRLCHFMVDSDWSDHRVRLVAAGYAIEAMTKREPIQNWIVDDSGWLKQGKHSVGVQRQYTGSAGKITNCQIGVSLTLATRSEHLPVDFELYLPHCWADDPVRRTEARIPEQVQFRTKPELAIDMIKRAVFDELPPGIVLADSAYGTNTWFREQIRQLNLHYAVAIDRTLKVWRMDAIARRSGDALCVADVAAQLPRKAFRRCTWREGTKEPLRARFARLRVVAFHDDGIDPARREDVWLVIEWPDGEVAPTKCYLSSLPQKTSLKRLVRTIKERWRIERTYQDLKGELGLDHYEGRRFPGWHHHISVVLCCYAFIIAERAQRFSPSARWAADAVPLHLAS